MTKIMKFTLIIILVGIISLSSVALVNSKKMQSTKKIDIKAEINPESNFFGVEENKDLVETTTDLTILQAKGYKFVAETSKIALYVIEKTLGIAIYDKEASYIWYSNYEPKDVKYSDTVALMINSGVTMECYDSQTLNETVKYSGSKDECEMKYEYDRYGFVTHLNFKKTGISFDVKVSIENEVLEAKALLSTLEEVPYKTAAMKVAKEYKLKSITLFPYFGAENYEINGYSFIPDGSGALIRFTNTEFDTAFIKRIYGNDDGITKSNTPDYLKNQNTISLPIYGINHGYNQAAFLAEVTNGYGSAELNAYPYMYSNLNLNRTFFKFIARDKFNIQMASSSSGAITLINDTVYTDEYTVKYTFLNNESANYAGMAKVYKKSLGLDELENNKNIPLKLDVVAQDYKKGLFGKNFIELTTYNDLTNILKELTNNNVAKINVNYIGYNAGGFFDNTLTKIKLDNDLGSKKDFENLTSFAESNDIDIYYYSNPGIATKNTLSKKTVKRTNLEQFTYSFYSSLEQTGKILKPEEISKYFLSNLSSYNKLNMTNFTFEYIGQASFSYRYSSENVVREKMIDELVESIKTIKEQNTSYKLSLYKPNNYLLKYITNYYDAPTASSKYAFITDSVPFISLVVSNSINQFASNMNYVSDYNLMTLRLIEYNIYPSYMITEESASLLRYTNYEYLYTTEYALWKDQIESCYLTINNALGTVLNAKMIGHCYISTGIAKIDYSNGVTILVNYTNSPYQYFGKNVSPMNYLVIGGNK